MDQYRYVGPALFEIGMYGTGAGFVRRANTGVVHEPREVWLPVNRTWVRADGSWISGWDGDEHFAFRPHWLNRWRLRRAISNWAKRLAPTPEAGGA